VKKIIFDKWIRNIEIATIKSGCQKNYDLFVKGLNLISANSKSRSKLFLVKKISSNNFVIKCVMNILFLSNLIRKEVFGVQLFK
jgi:hypothetical protein